MLENNSWPLWLKEIWPSWLEGIGYPETGVGDLGDLKLTLGVGEGSRWVGYVNPGWYYHWNVEQYNYVQAGTRVVSGVTGSGEVTESISFRPAWGPVLIQGIANDLDAYQDGPYREHHNSFYPAYSLSWALHASGVYVATLPSSSILVNMRNLTTFPMGSVAGTGLLTNDKVFYYDLENSKVYIRPKNPSVPDVWADLLYTYPKLRFREVVVNEQDGSGGYRVRPSYSQIEDLKVIYAGNTQLSPAYHASGYLSHSVSGAIAGSWIVLDYWISKSFILKDHKTLQYYTGGSAGTGVTDSFTIFYETSIPDILPSVMVSTPASDINPVLNLNPMFQDGYRSGYLFHANPASSVNSYWTAEKMMLSLDKSYVCRDWQEPIKAKLMVLADTDLPLPYYPVTVSITGGSALLQLPNGRTDGRGEVHVLIKPSSGATVLTIAASCGSLSTSVSASVLSSGSVIDLDKWYNGHVSIVISNEKTGRGAYRTFTSATTLDGLPKSASISLVSKLASEFHNSTGQTSTKNLTVNHTLSLPQNLAAMVEFGYVPQPNDELFGYSGTGISRIIKGEI